ncbi:MAG: glycoside hydrolase family 25 protein [Nanoarchaeota archaeon]
MTGIDVSSNNGIIDWASVKSNPMFNVDFAIIKSDEGVGYNDPQRALNSQNAKHNNIKIGYYHFASLNSLDVVKDATEEANYFMKSMSILPKADLPPVLDIETNKKGLTKNEVLSWINAFIKTIQKSYPMIVLYSYAPFLNENLPPNHNLGNIPLWIAQYPTNYRPDLNPKLPNGWNDYWMWQYSSKGKVNGIKTNVDLNIMKTSL